MHPQLGIGNLHSTHKLLELIRKSVEVVALALEVETGLLDADSVIVRRRDCVAGSES